MTLTIYGKEYDYPEHVPIRRVIRDFQDDLPEPVLLIEANGRLRELHHKIHEDSVVKFIFPSDKIGFETMKRSYSMLFLTAVYHVLGDEKRSVTLHFSIDHGFFYTISGIDKISEDMARQIEMEMKRLSDADLPFSKTSVSTGEAMRIFHRLGMTDKEKLFTTRLASRVNLYVLDDYMDYYYGYMLESTGLLRYFRVHPYRNGAVLQMPARNDFRLVPQFRPSEKLFEAQAAGEAWAEKQGIGTVGDLNERMIFQSSRHTILVSEAMMDKRIAEIADQIQKRNEVKFVMIAGPSSSGKTTFSQRLSIELSALGYTPHYIGVDNYFLNREEVPLDAYGDKDFESLRAIDLALFGSDMQALLDGKTIRLPSFDFLSGKRVYTGQTLELKKGEILIIEGIHCLNDELSSALPKESKFKIYISALTQVNIDEHNRIPTTDGRLIRRIVRDYRTRGYTASNTLKMWDSVRRGEETYIFPFQDSVDAFFNSALPYELAALKIYAEPLLFQVREGDPAYAEARRLLKFLDYFIGIASHEDIPNNSILREFIGGGCFHL